MERLAALEQAVFLIHLPLPSSAEASSKLLTGVYPECLCPLELEFSESILMEPLQGRWEEWVSVPPQLVLHCLSLCQDAPQA